MKTRIVLLAIFFSIFIFWSCEKETILDPIIPDPVPTEKYITVTASAGVGGTIDPNGKIQLKLGDTKIYTVNPDTKYGIKSVIVNGIGLNLSSNTFEVKADVFADKDIKVEFVFDRFLILTKNEPYYLKGYKVIQDGKVVDEPILDPKREGTKYFYYSDGTSKVYNAEGTLVGSYIWSFKDYDTLLSGNMTLKIITLTEKEFVMSSGGFYYGKPCDYVYTYFRL